MAANYKNQCLTGFTFYLNVNRKSYAKIQASCFIRCSVVSSFLVLWCEEVSVAGLQAVDAVVQQEPDHGRVLVDDGHVQDILT